LPKPAGAETSVNLRPASGASLSTRRGRATSFGRDCDGRSLVETSGSKAPPIPHPGSRFQVCLGFVGLALGPTQGYRVSLETPTGSHSERADAEERRGSARGLYP
jgi:hypothetical protein